MTQYPWNRANPDDRTITSATVWPFIAFEPSANASWNRARRRLCTLKQVAQHYPNATKIRLVQDNLNTHNPSSQTFEASAAFELTQRFEMYYTPKKGSWLNMVEIELSVLSKQCLSRRIGELSELDQPLLGQARNRKKASVNWQFTLIRHGRSSTDFILIHQHNLSDEALASFRISSPGSRDVPVADTQSQRTHNLGTALLRQNSCGYPIRA